MGEDEKPDIDSIVDLAMQEYEEELRRVKKNVLRTPALDSQFVNFCQDVYVHYNDKQVALGEAPITEESNVKEFIDDLVVAYNEFFTLIERSPKIKASIAIPITANNKPDLFLIFCNVAIVRFDL